MRTTIDRVLKAACREPWAILPEKLEEILAFLEARAARAARAGSEEVEAEELRARFAQPPAGPSRAKGVAVLPLFGTIHHRAGLLGAYSGGTSTEEFRKVWDEAAADPAIGTIVLDVNSPGGTVSGVPELADHLRRTRERSGKRILAVANPLMASAAYGLGAQAHEVIVAPSAKAGSIGVFALHQDYSEALKQRGIKPTLISAGKYKTDGNPYEPLSKTGRQAAQDTVDDYYQMFVDAVAAGRGVTAEEVAAGYGEGRVLTAARAVEAGLADRIATLEDVLAELGVSPDGLRETAKSPGRLQEAASLTLEPASAGPEWPGPPEPVLIHPGNTEPNGTEGSQDSPSTHHKAPEAEEEKVDKDTVQAPDGAQEKNDNITLVRDAEVKERKRSAEISELCHLHGVPEKATAYIAGEKSVTEIGMELARERYKTVDPFNPPEPQTPTIDLGRKDREKYSLGLAVKELLTGKPGLGHEVSEALHKEQPEGWTSQGTNRPSLLLDLKGFREYSALDTGTATAGQELVFTEPGAFIDLLRNRAVCFRMGATRLPGLVGNVAFPAQDAAGTGSWVGDDPGSDVADSDLTLTQVTMSPKIYQHPTAYSRLLERQSVEAIQRIVENDILAGHALAIDLACLHGASGGDNPVGVYDYTGVNAVAFGGAATFAKVVEMESALAVDNALLETLGYVFTPEVAGGMKTTDKGTDTGQFLWDGPISDGLVNGYRAMATNQLAKTLGAGSEHGAVFAAWAEMIIGEWGTLEIVVDPYTKKKQGLIELTSYQTADMALRHAEAFAKATGLTT